jgi:predicted nucleic acid-binding protein
VSDFVDTNVLLYLLSQSPDELAKKTITLEILDRQDLVLSAQVLGEFYSRATRPKLQSQSQAVPEKDALQLLQSFFRYEIVSQNASQVLRAVEISRESQISYWDSAIIAAAESAGCDCVLTEDLNHGQKIGSVQVVNPFISIK